jgi:hypothetical protein
MSQSESYVLFVSDRPVWIKHRDVDSPDVAESGENFLEDVLARLVVGNAGPVVSVHEPLGWQVLK